ncbi:MAG: hypothetical protein WCJ33_02435 [Pseudomonadota bacterium]
MGLPRQWNEITTEMYQKIYPIAISTEYESEIEKLIDIAGALNESALNELPIGGLKHLKFLLHPESIVNTIPKAFTFKGKIYRTETEIQNIKGGQYIDLTSYTSDADKIIPNLHYLIAIMTSEVNWFGFKKKYSGEAMIKRAELFKKLPITITYPLCVFFVRTWKIQF